jgi:hypothetical protein
MAIWSIETQFLEGTLDGPRILASSLCTMYVSSREKVLDVVKKIPQRYGLYILLGKTEFGELKAYIGQTKDFQQRVRGHLATKPFWENALVFVSNADRITSSEALYLEYLGIQKAIEVSTYNMEENAQVPPMPPISFGKRVEMAQFFEEIQIFLKFFGCHIFEKLGRKKRVTKSIPSPAPIPTPTPPSPKIPGASLPYKEYHFAIKKAGMSSRMRYYPDQDKFVILNGSLINAFNAPSLQPSIASFRNSVFSSSSCMKKGDLYQLLEDVEIPNGSPSAAAKFCAGTSRNGKTDWVDDAGHTIGEYLEGKES